MLIIKYSMRVMKLWCVLLVCLCLSGLLFGLFVKGWVCGVRFDSGWVSWVLLSCLLC